MRVNLAQSRADLLERARNRRPVLGQEIKLSLEGEWGCERFLREFCGIQQVPHYSVEHVPTEVPIWPIPDHRDFTYGYLTGIIEAQGVPCYDWTLKQLMRVDEPLDARQPAERILWTPSGTEAWQACPELTEAKYRDLQRHKGIIVSCREAVILWLLVFWRTNGRVILDPTGFTRTASISAPPNESEGTHGVQVNGNDGKLSVRCYTGDRDALIGGSRFVFLG